MDVTAATVDKANNSTTLNLGASWVGGVPPTAADTAQWSATVTAANVVSLGADTNWLGLKVTSPGGNVTINSGNTLTLGSGGIDLFSATRDVTLNCALATAAVQSWNVASARTLTLGNMINAGANVTLTGGGRAVLNASGCVFSGDIVISSGTWFLDPGASGTFTNATGRPNIGTGSSAAAVFTVNSGTAWFVGGGIFGVGDGSGSTTGTLNVSNATVNILNTSRALIGNKTAGILNVSGGTVNVGVTGDFVVGGDQAFALANASGTINLNAGTLNVTNGGNFILGRTNGTVTGCSGVINLNGGTLTTSRNITHSDNASSGTLNFNGGILRLAASQTNFLQGLSNVVKAGGAVLDVQSFAATIAQPLLDGTGGGGLVKLGGGNLTLAATNNYTGATVISNGTLTVNGLNNGGGTMTVKSGATLAGTGSVGGSVNVDAGAAVRVWSGDLAVGGLNLVAGSQLQLALGSANTGTNAALRVNGNLNLAGTLILTNAGGLGVGSNVTAIYYTGALANLGLAVDPLSEWSFTVDTSTTNLVRLVVGAKQPLAGFTNGNFAVTSTSTNLGGVLRGTAALPLWYEVHDQTNRLWDYGSLVAASPWSIAVRHLRPGTNTVTVFAKTGAGGIESNAVQLTFTLGANPPVRPRPHPAEIWWGGTCHTNIYSGSNIVGAVSRLTQLTNTAGWDFVKRFQDGFFLHGYVWVNDIARMTNWQAVGQSISAQLAPFNGRFWLEDAWRPRTNDMNYGHNAVAGQVANANDLLSAGIAVSEVTEDYNPMWEDFSRWHPDWPTNHLRVAGTGNTNEAGVGYPFTSGQWRDLVADLRTQRPNYKLGWTWSPVYFHWLTGAALADDGIFTVTSGTNVYSFNWDFYNWMNDAAVVGNQTGSPFAFASDCPWGWFGAWGNPTAGQNNRKKIRDYESWLQGQGLRHTLICNDATADALKTNPDLWDSTFKTNSLELLRLHQREGGRAARYLFESWYEGPFTLLPETKSGSYANLAFEAIKYLKGIADTNGSFEPLSLTLVSTGAVTVVRLQNDGSVACLPAILAFESGNPGTIIQYSNAAGINITAKILSGEGYAHTNLLQPGQSTTFTIAVQGAAPAQSKTVTLEAFWNPQDPTGVVRDRLSVTVPVLFGVTNTYVWTNTASGSWSTPSNWSNSIAPPTDGSENCSLRFLGGGTASNNLPGQFALNVLEANSAAQNNLCGNPLVFAATGPAGNPPQFNQNGAGTFVLGNSMILNNDLTLGGTGAGGITITGAVSGVGGIYKSGTAVVTLAGNNTFGGATRIASGTLVAGDGTNNSTISPLATNNATLRFVTAANTVQTHYGTIHGTGSFQKQGGGTLVLADTNTFSGSVNIGGQNLSGGVLRVANGNALGSAAGQTYIGGGASDARLELTGSITISRGVTLAQNNGSIVHIANIADTNILTGNVALNGGGNMWTLQSDAGRLVFAGNFTNAAGGFTRPLQLQGSGDGELAGLLCDTSQFYFQVRKAGAGIWTLSGSGQLPQGVQVNAGTLLVNGTYGSGTNAGDSAVNGGVLAGNGVLPGSVTVNATGVLSPGAGGIGTLTIPGDLTLAPNSGCIMEINKAGFTNDRVQGIGTAYFGGTLTVTNVAGSLAPGDTFQLFSAVYRLNTFTTLNLPVLPAGTAWTNRLLFDGSIAVVALPTTSPVLQINLSSPNLAVFNWTNSGSASYRLQSQTNPPTTGLGTNWIDYPGGTNPPVNVPWGAASGSVFFRLISP